MTNVNAAAPKTWADYALKYEEASNLVASTQDAISQLNTDLSNLTSGSYQQIQSDIATFQTLASSGYFPDLDTKIVNRYMTGVNQSLTQVLSNYLPMVNGSPTGVDMNASSSTNVNANVVSGDYKFLSASDIENLPGMPTNSNFQSQLYAAIRNSITVDGSARDPDYHCHDKFFSYEEDGITYSVDINALYAGPGGSKTRVSITANGALGSFASMGLVSVQLKAGGTAGVGALNDFLNSF